MGLETKLIRSKVSIAQLKEQQQKKDIQGEPFKSVSNLVSLYWLTELAKVINMMSRCSKMGMSYSLRTPSAKFWS